MLPATQPDNSKIVSDALIKSSAKSLVMAQDLSHPTTSHASTKQSNDAVVSESGKANNSVMPLNSANQTRVCYFYRNGYCRHGGSGKTLVFGKTCSFDHPKKCQTNRSCSLLHPILCQASVKYRECNDTNCKFQHLLGTVRPNSENQRHRQGANRQFTYQYQTRQYQTNLPPNNFQYSPNDFPPLQGPSNQTAELGPNRINKPVLQQSNAWNGENSLGKILLALNDLQKQNVDIKNEMSFIRSSMNNVNCVPRYNRNEGNATQVLYNSQLPAGNQNYQSEAPLSNQPSSHTNQNASSAYYPSKSYNQSLPISAKN